MNRRQKRWVFWKLYLRLQVWCHFGYARGKYAIIASSGNMIRVIRHTPSSLEKKTNQSLVLQIPCEVRCLGTPKPIPKLLAEGIGT